MPSSLPIDIGVVSAPPAPAAAGRVDSSFKPTLFLITGRLLAFAITFFIPVVLVRVFDQTQFGTYKQVFLIYATLFGIAQLGMAESLYYFLPLHCEAAGRYIVNSMVMLALAGLTSLALLGVFASRVASLLGNAALEPYVVPVGAYLLLMLASAVLEISMISRQRYRHAAYSYAISDVMRALFFLLPGALTGDVKWLLAGGVAFGALRLGAALWYLRHAYPGALRFDAALLRRQLAYAVPFEAAVIVEILQGNYHQYAVSHHFSAAVFAIYSVGCLQLPFVEFVANPACNVMMVRMGEQLRERRLCAVLALWHDTTRKLALIFTPMFVLLLISARDIIRLLFTDAYIAAVPIFALWSAVVVLAVFQTDGLMRVFAQTRFLVLLNAVRLAVVASLIGWSVGAFQLRGAVLVTLAATCLAKALALRRGAQLMEVRLAGVLPWKRLGMIALAAAAAAVPAGLARVQFALPPFPALLLGGSLYGAAYLAELFVFDLLEETEKVAVLGWLRRHARFRSGGAAPYRPGPMAGRAEDPGTLG